MGGFLLVRLLLSPLLVLVVVLAVIAVVRSALGPQQDDRRPPRKTTRPVGSASQQIRRTEARMDMLDVQHEREDCTFSYSTQDPTFSFNGRHVVDELAELRRKNEAHERHLLERVHRD